MSLKRITLKNFVIVNHLELDIHEGFTVLTGETGAGKSILIDALQLALGGRAGPGMIQEGATKADICAEFECPTHLHDFLEAAGFEINDSLLLRRTIEGQGKSRGWVNGTPATAAQLRTLGENLLDIHGQHAWQSLTRGPTVRGLLDDYAGISVQDIRGLWTKWRSDSRILQTARQAQDSLQRERDRLLWQIGELDKLSPSPEAWEELSTQHQRLAHAQGLLDTAEEALSAISHEDAGAERELVRTRNALQTHAHLEPTFSALLEIVESTLAQVGEIKRTLQAYTRDTDLDPERLSELDAQVALWLSMSRRYKRAPAELASVWSAWKKELSDLDAATDLIALEQAERNSASRYVAEARKLSLARTKAASKLAAAITKAMQELGMEGGAFEVSLAESTYPGAEGTDEVEFLVAGHPGTTPKPIGKVASGGELSRIALAIAVTTSQLRSVPTLIFDEVDSGIGGVVASNVGKLMHKLGRSRQVLAVTHLPQVAAWADHHLVVSKKITKRTTTSEVVPIEQTQRVQEIARMLGGEQSSTTTLAHAEEMLKTVASSSPESEK